MQQRLLNTILSLFIFTTIIQAQYYNSGQSPASFKWYSLKTGHFRFIYPSSFSSQAYKTAILFENASRILAGKYGTTGKYTIPVVIHNHSIESNGYVAWAPKRVELFPMPGQDNIPMDHIEQLALHELTHVAQMNGLNSGVSNVLRYLFGEQYTGALAIYTPSWFLEGDAVVSETAHSFSGRGRAPSFEKHLKAILLENEKPYSYDKMIVGSYRDFTPDHYRFGYQMTAWVASNLGRSFWDKPLIHTGRNPFSLNPFNLYLLKNTGLTKRRIYEQTMQDITRSWSSNTGDAVTANPEILNPDKKGEYTNYYSPVIAGKDSIIALKASLYDIPRFVLINRQTQDEKKLFAPGYITPKRFSYAGGNIIWAEIRGDPRWENRGYSVIMSHNIHTGSTKQLTYKTRYFSPSVSDDGKTIVVNENSPENINSLVTLDAFTGKVISVYPLPTGIMAMDPGWSNDMHKIVFISYSEKGEGIMTFNLSNNSWDIILPPSHTDLESVDMEGNIIYYISSAPGTESIFKTGPGGISQALPMSKYGAVSIQAEGNELIYSDYSSNGYNIASLPANEGFEPWDNRDNYVQHYAPKIDSDKKLSVQASDSAQFSYSPERYRKWMHPFNLHSWFPFYTDINQISFDNIPISPGLTLMSQNLLSTLTTTIGYEYSGGDHFIHSGITYEGMYPKLDLDITWGGTPSIIQDKDVIASPGSLYKGLKITGNIYLPLHFSFAGYNQTLWPSLRLSYINNYIYDEPSSTYDYGQLLGSARIYFSNLRRMAHRDIWPSFGQVLEYYHTWSPTDNDLYGPANTVRGTLFLPGIFRNNSLRIRAQAEKQTFEKFLFYNKIDWPRGITSVISSDITSYSVDYAFPVAYPDLNIPGLLFLKRIRSSLFFDYAASRGNYYYLEQRRVDNSEYFSSTGAEFLADFSLLRAPFDFTAGLQAAWLPQQNKPWFNFIFNIDIFGFAIK